jgi:hypothetical protein
VDVAGLVEAVARGVPIVVACRARNLNPDTFQDWLNTKPEFALALAKAKEAEIVRGLTAIKTSTKQDEIKGWLFWLERVAREHFSPPQQSLIAGVQNNFTITFEKAKEIETMRAKLLPEVNARLGLTGGEANG